MYKNKAKGKKYLEGVNKEMKIFRLPIFEEFSKKKLPRVGNFLIKINNSYWKNRNYLGV